MVRTLANFAATPIPGPQAETTTMGDSPTAVRLCMVTGGEYLPVKMTRANPTQGTREQGTERADRRMVEVRPAIRATMVIHRRHRKDESTAQARTDIVATTALARANIRTRAGTVHPIFRQHGRRITSFLPTLTIRTHSSWIVS